MREAAAPALLALVAAALFVWSRAGASQALESVPPLPVRGASLNLEAAPAAAKDEAASIEGDGTQESPALLPFRLFAFPDYDPPGWRMDSAPLGPDDFPEAIRQWQGRTVEVSGYLIAVDVTGEAVEGGILARYPQGCCFGAVPVLDEWIDVTADPEARQKIGPFQKQVKARGRLEMGELMGRGGQVESLYRLKDATLESLF